MTASEIYITKVQNYFKGREPEHTRQVQVSLIINVRRRFSKKLYRWLKGKEFPILSSAKDTLVPNS